MQVHVDGIIFSLQQHGGVSVVFNEIVPRMADAGLDFEVSLELPLKQEPFAARSAFRGRVATLRRTARVAERYRRCRGLVDLAAPVFHSTYYRLPPVSNQASVVTVHDFAYERLVRGPRAWLHSTQKFAAIRQAQAVICVSEATRDDLLDLVGVRSGQTVHVVPNGVSEVYRPLSRSGFGAGHPPFVLFVGQRGRYKNFGLALAALQRLPDFELICVGGGPLRSAELSGWPVALCKRVSHRSQVGNEELNVMFNQAVCLLYPSGFEGFGIAVVEAMRAGCPAVGIPCKAVIEAGGDALVVADADGASLARAVEALQQPDRRALVRRSGLARATLFSWERCAMQTLDVYRALGVR